jgi:hypothetical protein
MTKVIFQGSIQGFRGKIGNLIYRQLPNGTTVVSQAPPKKTGRQKKRARLKRSPAQQAHNSRFQDASFYAGRAQTNPIYVELAAAAPMKTAYNLALSDWWHAPEIHCIERTAGRIRVEASDNIMVAKVYVTVFDQEGRVLEMGDAVRQEDNWWEFASQMDGRTVQAEAWDLPRHVTRVVV